MVDLLQYVNKTNVDPKTFLISLILIDQLVKIFNQGQYPISNSNLLGQVIVIIIGLFFVFNLLDTKTVSKFLNKEKFIGNSHSWAIIPLYFAIMLYLFVFSNNGVLSYSNNLDLNISLMLSLICSIIVVVVFFLLKDNLVKTRNDFALSLVAAITLVISIYFYPWFNELLIFWFIGILSSSVVINFSLEWFSYRNKTNLIMLISLAYFLMVLFLFIILLTELYIIFMVIAIISLLVLIITYVKRSKEISEKVFSDSRNLYLSKIFKIFADIKLPKMYSLVALFTIIISFSAFIPSFVTIQQPNLPNSGVRIMAYNLHFSQDNNGFDNIIDVAKFVSEVGPNFISFEEIMFNGPINGYSNMFGKLKNLLDPIGYKYSYHTTGTTTFLTNAFFSVYPIVNASTIDLLPKDQFFRTALNIVVDLGSGKLLRIVPVHLTSVIENATNPDRVSQGQLILDKISQLQSTIPVVILGDFNSFPEWPETQIFSSKYQDAWNVTNPDEPGLTWPTYGDGPNQRIDYIFVDNSIPVTSCTVSPNLAISDHNAIFCDLNY
jgi:endonuclease/exonuclease/phosphatase family metal-dependent hydrolase